MADETRTLLAKMQRLTSDAEFLLRGKEGRPRPTLAAQKEKLQEVEKQAMLRAGGSVFAIPGDASHKRATEQAREAVMTCGIIEVSPVEPTRALNPDADLDQELHRRHAERLTNWLETAKATTVSRSKRMYWKHLVKDFKVNNAQAVQTCGLKRAIIGRPMQGDAGQLVPSIADRGAGAAPLPEAAAAAIPLDWRAHQYETVVRHLPEVQDAAASGQQIEQFGQLGSVGGDGERPEHLKQSVRNLWHTVARLVTAVVTPCEPGLSQEMSRAAACRDVLEEDFTVHMNRQWSQSEEGRTAPKAFISKIAAHYVRAQAFDVTGETEPWAVAFLCLRAGDVKGAVDVLERIGDAQSAGVARTTWPGVKATNAGSRTLVPSSQSARALREFSEAELAANPFQCAVRLLLSRSARVRDVDAIITALTRAHALKYAQDHVWLHLALAGCLSRPEDAANSQEQQDSPYSLLGYITRVENTPPSALNVPLDPLLYCRVMLWSQCPAKAVSALLPPTCLPDLQPFSIDGLHLALILSRYGLLPTGSAVERQLLRQLEEYVVLLVPHAPAAALSYLRLLPEECMKEVFSSICLRGAVCGQLLGRVGVDGRVDITRSAAAELWHPVQCAQLARSAAETAKERGSVLPAVELHLLSLHYALTPGLQRDAASATLAQASARELLAFFNPKLSHAIQTMDDDHSPIPPATQEVLTAARMVFSHMQPLQHGVGDGDTMALNAFVQLYWIAVLSWNVSNRDVAKAWQAFSSLGVLPRTGSDVPALVEEMNYRCDAGTVRKVAHMAVLRVLDLIGLCMRSPDAAQAPEAQAHHLEMARALNTYQSQLRMPPSASVAAKLNQRRHLLRA
eukprot:TRINITY_DN19580_c0_g1_i1.p1 TRINITY_DN19580_c0_g1~~TRINITY_DN19580_c0_g1_i1.p1  ORF type:complete len:851 (+),score=284.22 TRINITY_DN19580_c0_g1_i1:76-2628(+)